MKQITVLVDNHPGVIADLSLALAQSGVNIETLEAEGAQAHGAITLTVDRYDEALQALKGSGFQAISEEALVLRFKDEAGALARHVGSFREAGINIQSMRIIRRDAGYSMVALVTDDNGHARKLVRDVLVGPSLAPSPPAGA